MNIKELITTLNEAVDRFSSQIRNTEGHRKSLHEQIELTQKLYDFITGEDRKPDADALERVFWESEADIPGWLLNLPFDLAAHDMVDEAVKISRRFSGIFETENFLGDLAAIYAEAGRKEEALNQLEENLNRFPDDVWIIIKAGQSFQTLKENEKAIELYERAYGMTRQRTYDRDGVLERLVPLLRNVGRDTEADELMKKEDEDVAEEKESSGEEKSKSSLPLRTKKIGRNEPCPCGSGKKFKKCCGKS